MNLAQKCFDRAKEEDPLGAAYLGLAYCEVPPDHRRQSNDEDFALKKRVRNLLKKASKKMESMKRTLMMSKLLGERLAEMTENFPGINRFISPEDNFYSAQVESKMAVLETHLRYINRAVGSSLMNEYVFAEDNEKEFEKSKEIYLRLADTKIIHHNRVRREWVDKGYQKLSAKAIKLIQENLDRSIVDPVIELLNDNINANHIEEAKFLAISKDRDEFWKLLKSFSGSSEQVCVLDMKKALEDLKDEHRAAFDELIGRYEVRLLSLDEMPSEPSKLFGETRTLFRLNQDNSIHFYHRAEKDKWKLTQLATKRLINKCNQLPSNEQVTQQPDTVFFTLNKNVFSYSYFSRINNKVITAKWSKEESRSFFESYHSSVNQKSLILSNTIASNEEPLHRLGFDQNLTVSISPTSNQPDSKVIYDAIFSCLEIPVKFIDSFDLRDDIFDTQAKLELKKTWDAEGLLSRQERIYVENSTEFIAKLKKYLTSCVDKRTGAKYTNIAYGEHKNNGLYKFFEEFFESKKKCAEKSIRDYLYSSEMPFRTRKDEAEVAIKVLHDIQILKSGGLALSNFFQINYAYISPK